jgi:hypothetical protein
MLLGESYMYYYPPKNMIFFCHNGTDSEDSENELNVVQPKKQNAPLHKDMQNGTLVMTSACMHA